MASSLGSEERGSEKLVPPLGLGSKQCVLPADDVEIALASTHTVVVKGASVELESTQP